MRFQTNQHMKLGQSMKMAPRMIQSMEILQMPLAELCERIEQELESNPTIELTEIEPQASDGQEEGGSAVDVELNIDPESASDFARLDEYTNANPDAAENTYSDSKMTRDFDDLPRSRVSSGERDGKMDAMASAPARQASLTDQLLDQWALTDIDDRIRAIGAVLIHRVLMMMGICEHRLKRSQIVRRLWLNHSTQARRIGNLGCRRCSCCLSPPGLGRVTPKSVC